MADAARHELHMGSSAANVLPYYLYLAVTGAFLENHCRPSTIAGAATRLFPKRRSTCSGYLLRDGSVLPPPNDAPLPSQRNPPSNG